MKINARCINNEGFEHSLRIGDVYECILPGLPGSTELENPDDYYFVLTGEVYSNPTHDSRIVKRDKFILVNGCVCLYNNQQYSLKYNI